MATTKINSKGQITIPLRYREILGLRPGTKIAVVLQGEKLKAWPIWNSLDYGGTICEADALPVEEQAKALLKLADHRSARKRRIPDLKVSAGHESA